MSLTATGFDEDQVARMKRAITEFRTLIDKIFKPVLQVVTRRQALQVLPHASTSMTDGFTVWLRVPLELGDTTEHDKHVCGQRDPSNWKMLCPACEVMDSVLAVTFHEAAHIVFESFTDIPDHQKRDLYELFLKDRVMESRPDLEEQLREKLVASRRSSTAMGLAGMVDGWLPMTVNVIEDCYVNDAMFQDREGVEESIRRSSRKGVGEGRIDFETGETIKWESAQPDARALMVVYCLGQEMHDLIPSLGEDVQDVADDPIILEAVARIHAAKTAADRLGLAATVLGALRAHGRCIDSKSLIFKPAPSGASEETDDMLLEDPTMEGDPGPSDGDPGETDSDDEDGASSAGLGGAKPEKSGDGKDKIEADDSHEDDDADDDSDDEDEHEDDDADSDEASDGDDGEGDDSDEPGDEEADGTGTDEGDEASDGDDGDDDEGSDDDDEDLSDEGDEDDDEYDDEDDEGTSGDDGDDDEGHGHSEDSEDYGAPGTSGDDAGDEHGTEGDPADSEVDPGAAVPVSKEVDYAAEEAEREKAEGDLKKFMGHPDEEAHWPTTAEAKEQELLDLTLEQIDYFDEPSIRVRRIQADKSDTGKATLDVPVGIIAPSMSQLRVAFTENRKVGIERSLTSGPRLDGAHLARLAVGDDRIFARRSIPKKRDWFVVIGLDLSGSTGSGISRRGHGYDGSTTRYDVIKTGGYAMAEMLSKLGIKFAIFGHSGVGGSSGGYDLKIIVGKEPDEPWGPAAKNRVAKMRSIAANLDGHTLEYYRRVAMQQRATDKLIMYFTDGAMPAENYAEELAILQKNIVWCKRHNIHLVGVGVGNDDPKQHGLDTIRYDSLEDMPVLIRGLRDRLTA